MHRDTDSGSIMIDRNKAYPNRNSANNSVFKMKMPLSMPKHAPEDKYINKKKDFYRYNLLSNRVASVANDASTERSYDADPILSSRRASAINYPSTLDVISRARNN